MARKEKEADRAWRLAYYQAHKEKFREKARKYIASHRAETRAYREGHKAQRAAGARARLAVIKMAAFNAYGGPRCACCGETLIEGLGIDHINGDGAAHRKEYGTGAPMYRWLKNNSYPPGFQVLCNTCNWAKGTGDHCPHQDAWV